jgi:hypothetical protein
MRVSSRSEDWAEIMAEEAWGAEYSSGILRHGPLHLAIQVQIFLILQGLHILE